MNIEYRHVSGFKNFFQKIAGKTLAVMYDVNTKPYALSIIEELKAVRNFYENYVQVHIR